MKRLLFLVVLCFCISTTAIFGQLVINEGSNRNGAVLIDEDGDYEDWIEIYNNGLETDLYGYGISDDATLPLKWTLPNQTISANGFALLFASGKDRKPLLTYNHWEQPISDTATWKYIIPSAATPSTWIQPAFDDAAWLSGNASVGYGDGDDATVVPDLTRSVYLRYHFNVADVTLIEEGLLSMDFDDGFIAYLNGHVIAMYGFAAASPAYNAFSDSDHEAAMYGGGVPEHFNISADSINAWLMTGGNVLAVEVHNVSAGSSDLTARPFLSLAVTAPDIIWTDVLPAWFPIGGGTSFLHTNFTIAPSGEMIYLSDPAGLIIDSLFVGVADADQSNGRITDGAADMQIFTTPTPNASNGGTSYPGYTLGDVTFTLDAGFYSGSQTIGITHPAGTIARYTLNGEIPTSTSPIYLVPITIDTNTVFRVRLFDLLGELLPGRTFTNTYFIDENITTAVISISTNEDNLYGANGIFDNWWTDWKKLCYVEYFDTLGINQFEQQCGFKVDGGAGGSRSLAQKSMRIEPDNPAFGDGTLNYPLIPRRWDTDEYETFYLRNGSNMSNVLPYKDAFMVRTTEGTYNEHMAYTPVVVFINGAYWGVYELRNKLDEGHFDHVKGIEKDSLDLMTLSYWYGLVLRTLSGSDTDFIEMRNYLGTYPTPVDDDFYDIADSILDLNNFTDYIICQTWFANYDWPYNNIKAWRDRGGDNKWRYAIIDVELGLGIGGWSDANANLIPGLFYTQQYIEPLATLLQNPKYREYFINRYADLMNSTYLTDRTLSMEDSIYNEIYPELPRQLERWGYGAVEDQLATFEDYRNALRNDFSIRTNKVRLHIKDGFALENKVDVTLNATPAGCGHIQISTLDIYDFPWTGVYFNGNEVQVTAVPLPGCTFDHWEANPFITDIYNPTFKVNIDAYTTTFTAVFTGTPYEQKIAVSELNYHPESSLDDGNWIEIVNAGADPVSLDGWYIRDSEPYHRYDIPAGIELNSGDRWVFADDTAKFHLLHPDVSNVSGPLGFGIGDYGEDMLLINARNEIVEHMHYDDAAPWPLGADGHGRTLERNDMYADVNDPLNWFDGCIGGSPGLAYSPCEDPIVFSEINYNSNAALDAGDWIELHNVTDEPLHIGEWIFMDDSIGTEHQFMIPSGTTLEPHAHLVLAQDLALFNSAHPGVTNVIGGFPFTFSGNGEWLRLYDQSEVLSFAVDYQDITPWPTVADGAGYTLELVDSLGVMNDGNNWTAYCLGGSPGTFVIEPCPETIAINQISDIQSQISVYPNPVNQYALTAISIEYPVNASIRLFDAQGGLRGTLFDGILQAGSFAISLDMSAYPAGMYFLQLQSDNKQSTIAVIKQ